MIIYKETGEECQRLLFQKRIDEKQHGARLIGVYSMESDTIILKYESSARFTVIPADKNKTYDGMQ